MLLYQGPNGPRTVSVGDKQSKWTEGTGSGRQGPTVFFSVTKTTLEHSNT